MGINVLFDSTARLRVEYRIIEETLIFTNFNTSLPFFIKFNNSILYFFKMYLKYCIICLSYFFQELDGL